ncbi:MAG: transposase family protein [bacterium]|nr:transposase family protein [bacterium]
MAEVLDHLIASHGKPESIQCDQGTEFTSMAMDLWAYADNIGLQFSRPGTPGDNARNEAFKGLVRRECLTHHYFLNLAEAAAVLHSWREDYNNVRPTAAWGRSRRPNTGPAGNN